MLKIRRSCDRLIFNTGIPYPGKTVFILRLGPGRRFNKMPVFSGAEISILTIYGRFIYIMGI